MREFAAIIKTEQGIWAQPLITDSCLSCTQTGCTKRGKAFSVANPQQLPVHTGDIVRIQAPVRHQAAQGITALLFPLGAACAGYAAAGALAAHSGAAASEAMRAAGVLIGLFTASALVFIFSRGRWNIAKPEIASIIKTGGNAAAPAQ